MLTPGVVFLCDNARPHMNTAARTQSLLEHFNWELFDHPPYSPDLAPRDYHLFTHVKYWLRSRCFNNNELMESVKMWLSSQMADFFDTSIKNLFPVTKSASIPAVTPLRSSLSVYVFFVYNIFVLIACFVKDHQRLLSE
jgi:hypothetical protein